MECPPLEVDRILSDLDKDALVDIHELIARQLSPRRNKGDHRLPRLPLKRQTSRSGRRRRRQSTYTPDSSSTSASFRQEDRQLLTLNQLVGIFLKAGSYSPQSIIPYIAGVVELYEALSDIDDSRRLTGLTWVKLIDYLVERVALSPDQHHHPSGSSMPSHSIDDEPGGLTVCPAWMKCSKFVDSAMHPGESILTLHYSEALESIITTHDRSSVVSIWSPQNRKFVLVQELRAPIRSCSTESCAMAVCLDQAAKIICVLYADSRVSIWERVFSSEENKSFSDAEEPRKTEINFRYRNCHKLRIGRKRVRVLLNQMTCIEHHGSPWLLCDVRGGLHFFALETDAKAKLKLSHVKSVEGVHSGAVSRLVRLGGPVEEQGGSRYLLSASLDGTFCVIETKRLTVEARVTPARDVNSPTEGVVRGLAYSARHSLLVVATSSPILPTYTLQSASYRGFRRGLEGHERPLTDVAVCLDGAYVASIDEGSNVIIWDAARLSVVTEIPSGKGQLSVVGRLLVSLPGKLVVAGKRFYTIRPNTEARKVAARSSSESQSEGVCIKWAALNEFSGRLMTVDSASEIRRHCWSPDGHGKILVGLQNSAPVDLVYPWSLGLDGGARDLLVTCRTDGSIDMIDQFAGCVVRQYPSLLALGKLRATAVTVNPRDDCCGTDLCVAAPGPVVAITSFNSIWPSLAISTSWVGSQLGGPVWLFSLSPSSGPPRCHRVFHPGPKAHPGCPAMRVTCTSLAHVPISDTLLCGCQDGKVYRYALQPFSCVEILDVGGRKPISGLTVLPTTYVSHTVRFIALHGDGSGYRVTVWRATIRPTTAAKSRSTAPRKLTTGKFSLSFDSLPLAPDWQQNPICHREAGSIGDQQLVLLSCRDCSRPTRTVTVGEEVVNVDVEDSFVMVGMLSGIVSVVSVKPRDIQRYEQTVGELRRPRKGATAPLPRSRLASLESTYSIEERTGGVPVVYSWCIADRGACLPLRCIAQTSSGDLIVVVDKSGAVYLLDLLSGDLHARFATTCDSSWLNLKCVAKRIEHLLRRADEAIQDARMTDEDKWIAGLLIQEAEKRRRDESKQEGRVGVNTEFLQRSVSSRSRKHITSAIADSRRATAETAFFRKAREMRGRGEVREQSPSRKKSRFVPTPRDHSEGVREERLDVTVVDLTAKPEWVKPGLVVRIRDKSSKFFRQKMIVKECDAGRCRGKLMESGESASMECTHLETVVGKSPGKNLEVVLPAVSNLPVGAIVTLKSRNARQGEAKIIASSINGSRELTVPLNSICEFT
ncbi:hypothetical protein FOL47_007824 [Perkinsus chesapeaki]|uniref:Uncharacterized protein n=1 Tax=Perkinsus chesapeaki TaxID=330153 RepID=A0A7J6LHM0_PERCH|nr:hypothetical protein FOL47_007824 [Perkinsus chesapeaki]